MTTPELMFFALYFAAGVAFGFVTYRRRHFFSEGGARPQSGGGALEGRLAWCAICGGLWPLFVVTGAWNLLRLSGRRPDAGHK